MRFAFRPLCTGTALSLLALVLTHCELLVDLDRGDFDAGAPEGCPICTNLTEAGDEEEVGNGVDASIGDAVPDAVSTETTDGGPDVALTDASGESAAADLGGE